MKKQVLLCFTALLPLSYVMAQSVTVPPSGFNLKSSIGQQIGTTDVTIHWNAPGVKGREGQIWGTQVAHYGFQDLGFGTSKAAPWRAGANENTTISFSTPVMVEGKPLAAGEYGFFVALYPDSCTLIFSREHDAWGSYFYDPAEDALRVTVRQEKNRKESREWLQFSFSDQTPSSAVVALEWERWRIPFTVSVNLPEVTVDILRREYKTSLGFDDSNWLAGAQFCLQYDYNLEEALVWAENAVGPPFGQPGFAGLSVKAQILEKLGRSEEAARVMSEAMNYGGVFELHGYGRQLIAMKQPEKALEAFLLNYQKHGDTWPTHVGLTRGYSAAGQLDKALEHAKIALEQAPDDLNRQSLQKMIEILSSGAPIPQ